MIADINTPLGHARFQLLLISRIPCEHGYVDEERDDCGCGACQAHGAAIAGLLLSAAEKAER